MKIEIKGMYNNRNSTPLSIKGRSFHIGYLNGSVQILNDRVQIVVSSTKDSLTLQNVFAMLINKDEQREKDNNANKN